MDHGLGSLHHDAARIRLGEERADHFAVNIGQAALTAVGDAVYFCDTQGQTTVVACDRTLHLLLAQNDPDEPIFALFAAVDDTFFVRTRNNLYCLRRSRRSFLLFVVPHTKLMPPAIRRSGEAFVRLLEAICGYFARAIRNTPV